MLDPSRISTAETTDLSLFSSHVIPLELFLLLEEHREADDGAVDKEAARDGHDHRGDVDKTGVSENDGKSCEEQTRVSMVLIRRL